MAHHQRRTFCEKFRESKSIMVQIEVQLGKSHPYRVNPSRHYIPSN